MHIMAMSLATARKSDEVMGHLHQLRHQEGWFKMLLESNASKHRNVLVLIALEGGEPVGALFADELKVGIFVVPRQRREGVGTALMEEAFLRIGKHMSCVLDDEGSTRFFMQQRRELELQLLPTMNPDWTLENILDTASAPS